MRPTPSSSSSFFSVSRRPTYRAGLDQPRLETVTTRSNLGLFHHNAAPYLPNPIQPYNQSRPSIHNPWFRHPSHHTTFNTNPMPPHKPSDYRAWEYARPPPPSQIKRFRILSYNILADYLAINHQNRLYRHISPRFLDWEWRKRSIIFELGLWSSDIMCFQEVDRFQDLEAELKPRGYHGIWKMRTGNAVDGCAIFWKDSRFRLLHEESTEFNKHGLRDNVAQICVLEIICQTDTNKIPAIPTSSTGSNKVVVCNIHVLYNPKRGEIKIGQVKFLLDRAHVVSKLWNEAPVVLCGDFNCTPKSPLYNFISEQKINLTEFDRDKLSGQDSAEIYSPKPYNYNPSLQSVNRSTQPTTVKDIHISMKQNDPVLSLKRNNPENKSASCQISLEHTNVDVAVEEQPENNAATKEDRKLREDSQVFLSQLHDSDGNFLSDFGKSVSANLSKLDRSDNFTNNLMSDGSSDDFPARNHVPIDTFRSDYNPSNWTPADLQTATGNAESTLLNHPLKLKSTYTETEDRSGSRDSNGEPVVTSYHNCFSGTVDYIWRSEGLRTVRVLAPMRKDVIHWTRGFPTRKWGSDHIALVSELAFTQVGTDNNTEIQ